MQTQGNKRQEETSSDADQNHANEKKIKTWAKEEQEGS